MNYYFDEEDHAKNEMDYYYNKDHTKIAVLVSHGFGAGWATWNDERLAYDKRVVEFWLDHNTAEFCRRVDAHSSFHPTTEGRIVESFLESCGYQDTYLGGYADIRLEWVNRGVPFRIDEYDGNERLETFDDAGFKVIN